MSLRTFLRLAAEAVVRAFLDQRVIVVPLDLPDLRERMGLRVIKETVDPPAPKVLLERRATSDLEGPPVLLEKMGSPVRSALRAHLA